MKQYFSLLLSIFIISACCNSCSSNNDKFPESFEWGSKDSYAYGELKLQSGVWAFDNALIGKSGKDHKHGKACVRLREKASLEMLFDIPGNKEQVTIVHASYGRDKPATWQLQYSIDGGSKWIAAGNIITTSGNALKKIKFHLAASNRLRVRIQKTGGGRLNIDDISFDNGIAASQATTQTATRDDNLALGNPSQANAGDPDNFLIVRRQYAMSYNNRKGTANWVSWHLSTAWKGDSERCNCFGPDNDLPDSYTKINSSDYTASGFDRGHLCPSDDRDGGAEDNATTFLMSNITPQAPNLNRDTWEKLESYCRKLIVEGYELYIFAGVYGIGGAGSKGEASTIAHKITVPAHYWKVIVVLPVGDSDMQRINEHTRIIAVDMPNSQEVNVYDWRHYRTSVDAIENITGYDLLPHLPVTMQKVLEANTDGGPSI